LKASSPTCGLEYWLDAAATGNGYISEALALLEPLLFNRGYTSIELQCAARNIVSQDVAARAGYRKFSESNYWVEADNSIVHVYEFMKKSVKIAQGEERGSILNRADAGDRSVVYKMLNVLTYPKKMDKV
jgi:hypothetical protein